MPGLSNAEKIRQLEEHGLAWRVTEHDEVEVFYDTWNSTSAWTQKDLAGFLEYTHPWRREGGRVMVSKRTTVREAPGAFGRVTRLVHRTAGVEPAGAGRREVGEAWGYLSFDRDGTPHGQWFDTRAEAEETFDRFTTPIVEIPAADPGAARNEELAACVEEIHSIMDSGDPWSPDTLNEIADVLNRYGMPAARGGA